MHLTKGEIRHTITGTRIFPYTKHQSYQLENMTSIKVWGTWGNKKVRNPITGFLIPDDKDDDPDFGTFITHRHDAVFIQNLFPDYTVKYEDPIQGKQLNHSFSLNGDVTPREAQAQIIDQIIMEKDSHQWFVYLSQGLGKTLLSVYMISYFNTRTLIMCYNTQVLRQWINTFGERTSIDLNSILFIDSGKIFDKIIEGSFPVWEYDIFMCTPKILTMYGERNGYESISIIFEKMGIGLKIFDEAHRNITNIIKINAYSSIDKTLYLSGDFAQSNKRKETLYYRMFYDVPVLEPSTSLMMTLKYTVAIVVSFNSKPKKEDLDFVYTRRGFSFFNYMKYQMDHPDKFFDTLWFILDSINDSNVNNFRILVLVNMIAHVDIVKEEIESHYPNRYIVGRYHSGVCKEEKEEARNHAELIVSTHSSFGVGIDISRVKYVISCNIGTKIDYNQGSGRARPLPDHSDAFYFMMVDRGFPYCTKTLDDRLDYLNKTKIKAIKYIKL